VSGIYSHEAVLRAVARTLILDPDRGLEVAIQATAQSMHIDVEDVRAIVSQEPAEASA
jgi:hypothetical protein